RSPLEPFGDGTRSLGRIASRGGGSPGFAAVDLSDLRVSMGDGGAVGTSVESGGHGRVSWADRRMVLCILYGLRGGCGNPCRGDRADEPRRGANNTAQRNALGSDHIGPEP